MVLMYSTYDHALMRRPGQKKLVPDNEPQGEDYIIHNSILDLVE